MVEFRLVPFSEVASNPSFDDYVAEYADECGNSDIAPPSISLDRYDELDKAGQLRCVGVFDGDELAGLSILLVTKSQHYDFPLVGVDSFYLRKSWRKGRIGLDLIGAMKAVAIKEGAPGLPIMAPVGSKLERLCRMLGMPQTHSAFWCKA